MIEFECTCGEQLAAAASNAGSTTQCPHCHATLRVPEPAYEFEEDTPTPQPADDSLKRREPVRRLMARAHSELDDDEVRRAREWRPVVFTPGLVGGTALFLVCTLLALVSLLLYNLYLAIGLLFFAVAGLFRAILSFVGRGVD